MRLKKPHLLTLCRIAAGSLAIDERARIKRTLRKKGLIQRASRNRHDRGHVLTRYGLSYLKEKLLRHDGGRTPLRKI